MTHNQTRHQWHRKSLLFSLLILLVAIGCKKKDTPAPTPTTAESLVGSQWIEIADLPADMLEKISFVSRNDTNFVEDNLLYQTRIYIFEAFGVKYPATQNYIFTYDKTNQGTIICKSEFLTVNNEFHTVELKYETAIVASFTTSTDNILTLTPIENQIPVKPVKYKRIK